MGHGGPGGYARSDDHWITLGTDGWRDGDIDWSHSKPHWREAFDGRWLWLLVSDSHDRDSEKQFRRVVQHIEKTGAEVHAQLFAPSDDELMEVVAALVAEATAGNRQVAVLFRGDMLKRANGFTLGEVAEALFPELGHCRLVLASCSAAYWAFGGAKPWGPHGATHASERHLDLFCASQPMQCAFTCTVPELYIDWSRSSPCRQSWLLSPASPHDDGRP